METTTDTEARELAKAIKNELVEKAKTFAASLSDLELIQTFAILERQVAELRFDPKDPEKTSSQVDWYSTIKAMDFIGEEIMTRFNFREKAIAELDDPSRMEETYAQIVFSLIPRNVLRAARKEMEAAK